jgi:predicted DNA-binding protein (MmcQ/YjbR family)
MLAMAQPSRTAKKSSRSPAGKKTGTTAKSPPVPRKSTGKPAGKSGKAVAAKKPASGKTPGKAVGKPAARALTSKKAAPSGGKKSAARPAPAASKSGKRSAAASGAPVSKTNHKTGLSAADAEMVADLLPRLREICLALPETTEVEAWGHPTFRVNNKIFASCGVEGSRASLGVKTTPDMQSALVMSDPRFTVAAYVGQHGWVSLDLSGTVDLGEVEMLVHGSYRLVAPARLVRVLDGQAA